jgi:hypothetical protein
MVCFFAAHYVAYFRTFINDGKTEEWHLYDDDKIKSFKSWEELILMCAETSQRPTLLFFEKVNSAVLT